MSHYTKIEQMDLKLAKLTNLKLMKAHVLSCFRYGS
jgi:hypothetical protein